MRAALVLLLALGACSPKTPGAAPATAPPAQTAAAQPSSAAGCAVTTARAWQAGAAHYTIEASLHGAACGSAAALLVIRNAAGETLYADAAPVTNLDLAFNPRADDATMARDVAAWISGEGYGPTAAGLPAWGAGAERPPGVFFAMTDRETYEAARAAAWPMFCYPNGGESAACVAQDARHGILVRLGDSRPEAMP